MKKIIAINGSPRKNWNTAILLQSALEGAKANGAETELINLYDYEFKGCVSCLVCKRKDSTANGLCAYKDALTTILEKCKAADAVILGSPIYFGDVTGMMRSFLERFLFPSLCYQVDSTTGALKTLATKKPIGFIYTMNATKDWCDTAYAGMCNQIEGSLAAIYGYAVKSLKVYNTCQVKNYADYNMDYFSETDKHQYRDEHFEKDKQLAFELGKTIIDE